MKKIFFKINLGLLFRIREKALDSFKSKLFLTKELAREPEVATERAKATKKNKSKN